MITLTVEGSGIEMVRKAAARARDLRPLFKQIAAKLRNETLRNFRDGGVFPSKWKPARRGGQTLVKNAVLRNSIHAESDGKSASVGTDVKYAAVHQLGAVIEPKKGKFLRIPVGDKYVFVKRVVIPPRPFLPVDDQGRLSPATDKFMAERAAKWVFEGEKE